MTQTVSNAGGSVFKITPMDQLDRFLILGSESNMYRSGAELARENARNVIALLRTDPKAVIDRIVEISDSGRAPKNEYALFALALAAADSKDTTRKMAFEALPKVARIGTHLFNFVTYAEQFRGWGNAMRKAIANWYLTKDVESLAYGVVKYQGREGWSNRDLLRKAHPKAPNDEFDAVFRWINEGVDGLAAGSHKGGNDKFNPKLFVRRDVSANLPEIIQAFEEAKTCGENRLIDLILNHNLPREAIPTHHLNSLKVWEALLEKMPMTAMIRNLATMTSKGLLVPGSQASKRVIETVTDAAKLKKARIHPMTIMMALYTYKAGRGVRGSNTWSPVADINAALNSAFYASFGNVEATGKPTVIGLDVSGSMQSNVVNGFATLTARDVSAAMAMVTARVEPDVRFLAFTPGGFSPKGSNSWNSSSVKEIDIDPKLTLEQIIASVSRMPFAGTDVSLPMLWAEKMGYGAHNFSVYTDNETYEHTMTGAAALKLFRKSTSIPAKLAVFGVTATNFSIADPDDAGMMDFVGFDSAAPQLAAEFFSK